MEGGKTPMRMPVLFFTFISVLVTSSDSQELSGHLSSLFEAERTFSKTSVAKGARPAFIEFFADDGIAFRPHPVVYKEWASKTPLPPNAALSTLIWEPMYGEVSAAGDLGWDTGPSSFVDNSPEKKPTQYGFFFSIWRRQPDNSWKVALDHGIQVPDAVSYFGLTPATSKLSKNAQSNMNMKSEQKAMMQLDRASAQRSETAGMEASYASILSSDARVYRNTQMPLVGKDSILAYFHPLKTVVTIDPIKAEIARSGDLGYTYGSYTLREQDSTVATEKGYYVRVWKRESDSKWRVVFDITATLPKVE